MLAEAAYFAMVHPIRSVLVQSVHHFNEKIYGHSLFPFVLPPANEDGKEEGDSNHSCTI